MGILGMGFIDDPSDIGKMLLNLEEMANQFEAAAIAGDRDVVTGEKLSSGDKLVMALPKCNNKMGKKFIETFYDIFSRMNEEQFDDVTKLYLKCVYDNCVIVKDLFSKILQSYINAFDHMNEEGIFKGEAQFVGMNTIIDSFSIASPRQLFGEDNIDIVPDSLTSLSQLLTQVGIQDDKRTEEFANIGMNMVNYLFAVVTGNYQYCDIATGLINDFAPIGPKAISMNEFEHIFKLYTEGFDRMKERLYDCYTLLLYCINSLNDIVNE